jgi:hypothetical protein
MANNILKEAIADAKAVREVALANAKAALEEAFTPKLQSMLSAKLSETLNEEEEELEENVYDEDMDKPMDEMDMGEEIDEISGMDEEDMGEEANLDEEIDLEEILNELELEEGAEAEEETVEEAKAEDDEKDLEEIHSTDPKVDDVQQVIHKAEDIYEEKDFDLDALLEEINNLDENEEEVEEGFMDTLQKIGGDAADAISGTKRADKSSSNFLYSLLPKSAASKFKPHIAKLVGTNAVDSFDEFKAKAAEKGMPGNFANWETYFSTAEEGVYEALESELKETKEALDTVRTELNEVNLLNSKLLYVNRIFKANTLDEGQKLRVVETLDKAGSVKEAKLIYETIKDSFSISKTRKTNTTPKKSIREGLGMASKAAGTSTAPKKSVLNESNDMVTRMQKLANIKIKQ